MPGLLLECASAWVRVNMNYELSILIYYVCLCSWGCRLIVVYVRVFTASYYANTYQRQRLDAATREGGERRHVRRQVE